MTSYSGFVNWFGHLPKATRLTVRREIPASVFLAVVMAALTAPFCGLIGRKALGMSDGMLALLMAGHMTGMLLVGPLIGFFNQKRKITVLAITILAVSVILCSVSLIPAAKNGNNKILIGYLFLIQVFLGQTGLALAAALRASVWRANYPARHRGKITIFVYLCVTCVSSFAVIMFSAAMDHGDMSFRPIYFISGLAGIYAAYLFYRVPFYRQKQLLRKLANMRGESRFLSSLAVLRDDKQFRRYMSWQMLSGLSTLIIENAVIIIVINDVFKCNWVTGGAALTAIPLVVAGVSGVLWARLFDRSSIFQMCFIGSLLWALGRVVLVVALWFHSIEIVLISCALIGVAMGLGQLSWQLGHMHFATPEKDALYMAAHISLTDFRGIIAPFIGIYLYRLCWSGPDGIWLIALAALGHSIAAFGFLHMQVSALNWRENATVNGLRKCAGLLRKCAGAKTQKIKNSVKKC